MGIDFSVKFDKISRESNGNVKGHVVLKISGEITGIKFDQQLDGRNFEFPKDGEQAVYDHDFDLGVVSAKVTANVYEKPSGQCCIKGYVHLNTPIGGGIGRDLDQNCQPIP